MGFKVGLAGREPEGKHSGRRCGGVRDRRRAGSPFRLASTTAASPRGIECRQTRGNRVDPAGNPNATPKYSEAGVVSNRHMHSKLHQPISRDTEVLGRWVALRERNRKCSPRTSVQASDSRRPRTDVASTKRIATGPGAIRCGRPDATSGADEVTSPAPTIQGVTDPSRPHTS